MLNHYLKSAIRILIRNKIYSVINIVGLAVGLGVCLLIYQYIQFELSYDEFHVNGLNTYRVVQTYHRNEENLGSFVGSPFLLGVKGKSDIPEIAQSVRVHPQYGGAVVTNPVANEPFEEERMLFVDRNFLSVFDFPLKAGSPSHVLGDKYNMVISSKIASKYFGSENPVGKTLKVSGGWAEGNFTITGVLDKLPLNSHFQFDFLMPMDVVLENEQYTESNGWFWSNFATYFVINKNSNPDDVEKKLEELVRTYDAETLEKGNYTVDIDIQRVSEIHLNSAGINDPLGVDPGNLDNIRIYTVIAIFILVIAWVNYINLSTARAMYRAKEVGIRKSVGAFKNQLIKQFLFEAGVTNIVAAVLAIILAYALLPVLNEFVGKPMAFDIISDLKFWSLFLLLILVGTVASGAYPSFVLSSFRPVSMLSGFTTGVGKGFILRKGLIVFQFVTSLLLISGTYLVYMQINYMKNEDMGIDMEQILILKGPRVDLTEETMRAKLQTFKNSMEQHHSIHRVCGSTTVPGKGYDWVPLMRKAGQTTEEQLNANIEFVDHDFFDTYLLDFLAGTGFLEEMATPLRAVVINKATLKKFDLGSAQEALQEKIVIDDSDTLKILGVIKNFHWQSLQNEQEPQLFALGDIEHSYLSIRVNLTDIPETLRHVEEVYRESFPNNPFSHFFLDDEFNQQYQADIQFGNLFAVFTLLAIFIACLGLFALVSFSTIHRLKEISIRKVLGASLTNLMILLSKEYMLLLLIANVISVPVIVYYGPAWLDDYAFRVSLTAKFFLVPGIVMLLISVLTVSFHTYITAKANPMKSLRSE